MNLPNKSFRYLSLYSFGLLWFFSSYFMLNVQTKFLKTFFLTLIQ